MRRIVSILALLGLVAAIPVAAPVSQAVAAARVYEKDANLDISRRVAALLGRAGVPVVMPRTTDRTTSLSYRTGLANARRVDAFVSIHNNAATSRSADWSEVYHQLRGGGSRVLGDAIRRELGSRLGQRSYLKTRRGDHGDYYFQLRTTRMPAVIVESAFLSNPRQARLLSTAAYRRTIAQAIFDGIMVYQRTLRRPASAPAIVAGPRVEVPALSPPARTRAEALNSHTVRLTWAVPEAPAGDVLVYRDGVALGGTSIADGVFEDVWAAPGQRYRYELRYGVRDPGPVALESPPAVVNVRTPPIVVCLDAGHGGRDTGAIGRW